MFAYIYNFNIHFCAMDKASNANVRNMQPPVNPVTVSRHNCSGWQNSTDIEQTSVPGCLKLTTSLVNVSLKFQTVISEICQYFLLKKMPEAFALQKLFAFLQQKIVFLVIKL